MGGWSSAGGFLSGFFGAVGPRLEEKHQQELALQNQKKQGEFNTYWNSMQAAATRLSQLKGKDKLTPEEEKEAQSLAQQYAWSDQQLTKITKGSKPLAEGVQKIGGFVKQLLTRPSPRGRLQPPQQSPQTSPQSAPQSGPLQLPAPQPSMQGAAPSAPGKMQPAGRAQEEAAVRQDAKPGPYKTTLSATEEAQFQKWVKDNGIPFDDSPTADYDMRGYYKALQSGDAHRSPNGHFPDTFKTPYHKTFSNESKYATSDAPHWQGNKLVDKSGRIVADETQQAAGRLQPPSMQGAMALAAQQSPEAQKTQQAEQDRARRTKVADEAKMTGAARAEFIETGRVPAERAAARPTALDLRKQAEDILANEESSEADKKAAQGYIDSLKKPESKVNYQAGMAKYPGDEELHVVRVNPKDPKDILDGDTGKPVPEGTHLIDKGVIMAQTRQDSYGAFGNYYRAAKGRGMSDEAARREAGNKVEKEFQVRLGAQEQNIAINQALSGIGAGGGSSSAPSSSAATAAPSAKPKSEKSPGSLSQSDREDVNQYIGSVLGTFKSSGKAGAVRQTRGLAKLAELTGLSPTQLSAELATDKATARALSQAVEVSGAFGRVQETLKQHGQVLLNAAKAYGPGNTPIANRTVQWIQENAKQHPELTRYTLALNAVQREYGRLIAGGVQSKAMLPVSSTEKGEAVLRRDATMADIAAAVSQLQIEADTEQKAFGDQIEGLKQKLSGGKIGGAVNPTPSPNGTLTPPLSNDDPLGVLPLLRK